MPAQQQALSLVAIFFAGIGSVQQDKTQNGKSEFGHLMKSNKKEKDFQKLEELLKMYRKYSDEKVIMISTSGGGNKPVIQACNIVLKERGLK